MVFDVLIFANFVVIMLSVIASVVGNGKQKGSKNAKSIKTMFKHIGRNPRFDRVLHNG